MNPDLVEYHQFDAEVTKRFFDSWDFDPWNNLEPSVPSRKTIISGSCEILAAGAQIRMAA